MRPARRRRGSQGRAVEEEGEGGARPRSAVLPHALTHRSLRLVFLAKWDVQERDAQHRPVLAREPLGKGLRVAARREKVRLRLRVIEEAGRSTRKDVGVDACQEARPRGGGASWWRVGVCSSSVHRRVSHGSNGDRRRRGGNMRCYWRHRDHGVGCGRLSSFGGALLLRFLLGRQHTD